LAMIGQNAFADKDALAGLELDSQGHAALRQFVGASALRA
jgi:hypothetical protein